MSTRSQEGQKLARKKLDNFHICLNSSSLLPSQTYIPNDIGFAPVAAINQIVALMISKNYERIPFMIKLAYSYFDNFNGKPVYQQYRVISFDYLCNVSQFLRSYTEVDSEIIENNIPTKIFTAGEREAPIYNATTQQFEKT